jgi:hypothetical protein
MLRMVRDAGFEPATPTVSVCVAYAVSDGMQYLANGPS